MVDRWLHAALGYAGHLAGLALFALVVAGGTLLYALAMPFMPRRRRRAIARRWCSRMFRIYLGALRTMGLVVADLDALDALAAERSLVLAPNHPCLLDAVLVTSRLPNVGCIMKSRLRHHPLLGLGARWLGYIRNDSPRAMVRQAVADLRRDGQLLVFPEGTRTVSPPVNPLGGDCALIAKRAGVPIQVLIIESDSAFLGKGWSLWSKPAFPVRYRVRLGPRIEPRGGVEELTGALRAAFERELAGSPMPRAATEPLGAT